jgi:hypothetical protein
MIFRGTTYRGSLTTLHRVVAICAEQHAHYVNPAKPCWLHPLLMNQLPVRTQARHRT